MAENFCQTDDSMDGKENYKQINYKLWNYKQSYMAICSNPGKRWQMQKAGSILALTRKGDS